MVATGDAGPRFDASGDRRHALSHPGDAAAGRPIDGRLETRPKDGHFERTRVWHRSLGGDGRAGDSEGPDSRSERPKGP